MKKVWEVFVEKFFTSFCDLCKLILLGYDKSEVIGMKRAVTSIYLKEGEYLQKRQNNFMLKGVILCVIISWIMMFKMPNWILYVLNLLEVQINNNVQLFEAKNNLILLVFLTILLHVLVFIYLNQTFIDHTYGYDVIGSLSKEIKYNKKALIVNVIYFSVDIYFIFFQNKIISLLLYLSVTIIFILLYAKVIILKNSDVIFRVKVREQGSKIYTTTSDTIDGETDINIKLVDGTSEAIDVFKENIYIVEDSNIVVLGKNRNITYDKDKIQCIDINNNMGLHMVIEYDTSLNRWVKR